MLKSKGKIKIKQANGDIIEYSIFDYTICGQIYRFYSEALAFPIYYYARANEWYSYEEQSDIKADNPADLDMDKVKRVDLQVVDFYYTTTWVPEN